MQPLIDKIFRDKQGRIVIGQFPNVPILVWAAMAVTGMVVRGRVHTVVGVIGTGALVVWAGLELVSGVNLFRKLLGLVVLVGIIVRLVV